MNLAGAILSGLWAPQSPAQQLGSQLVSRAAGRAMQLGLASAAAPPTAKPAIPTGVKVLLGMMLVGGVLAVMAGAPEGDEELAPEDTEAES